MTIHKHTDPQGIVRHYIEEMGSWDDFPVIVGKVMNSIDSVVVDQGDGPDARYCILLVEEHEIIFVHDDMLGNCFYSRDRKAYDVLQKIVVMFS